MGKLKLYGDFTKKDWLDVFGVEENQIPLSCIIHGEWNHEENLNLWKDTLKEELWLPKWNTVIGKYEGKNIGFANVYGSPIAAMITHQFASAGTNQFIQTGYFGGLSFDVTYGDILIVSEAEMKDGASHWYLPNRKTVKSDEQLLNATIDYCEKKGYSYAVGSVLSTSAILLETQELISEWGLNGHLGVDMETATTLAVAKRFDKKAIGLLNLSDHLMVGDTLYSYTKERELIEAETDEKIRDVALYLSLISNKLK
ncbi:uridine phosphorylase [Paenibacillus sp. CECT 9249]|uniref:phosphorylase family protein n=1 Tax=Paenibacillus sp. CECT 9249 TaxID=2845385 RepID=UPI001E4952DF|nr:uridine phosphorylase [Paenibacillus sp. CECT 9249]